MDWIHWLYILFMIIMMFRAMTESGAKINTSYLKNGYIWIEHFCHELSANIKFLIYEYIRQVQVAAAQDSNHLYLVCALLTAINGTSLYLLWDQIWYQTFNILDAMSKTVDARIDKYNCSPRTTPWKGKEQEG